MLSRRREHGKRAEICVPLARTSCQAHAFLFGELIKFILLNRNQVPASLDELANTLDRWHEQIQQLAPPALPHASSKGKHSCRRGTRRRMPRAAKRAQLLLSSFRRLLASLTSLFNQEPVAQAAILLGPSANRAKEAYIISFQPASTASHVSESMPAASQGPPKPTAGTASSAIDADLQTQHAFVTHQEQQQQQQQQQQQHTKQMQAAGKKVIRTLLASYSSVPGWEEMPGRTKLHVLIQRPKDAPIFSQQQQQQQQQQPGYPADHGGSMGASVAFRQPVHFTPKRQLEQVLLSKVPLVVSIKLQNPGMHHPHKAASPNDIGPARMQTADTAGQEEGREGEGHAVCRTGKVDSSLGAVHERFAGPPEVNSLSAATRALSINPQDEVAQQHNSSHPCPVDTAASLPTQQLLTCPLRARNLAGPQPTKHLSLSKRRPRLCLGAAGGRQQARARFNACAPGGLIGEGQQQQQQQQQQAGAAARIPVLQDGMAWWQCSLSISGLQVKALQSM